MMPGGRKQKEARARVRFRHRGARRWRGGRTGCGSGPRSVAASRPMLRRSRPACRRRSVIAGFATLAE